MKAEKNAPRRNRAWLTDPRLELPLLLLVIGLSLLLAGLILVPSVKNYVNYMAKRDEVENGLLRTVKNFFEVKP